MFCFTPIRAQDNRHPWLISSACGIVPQAVVPNTAFEFQQNKQPVAISSHDAFFCSNYHQFLFVDKNH